MTNLNAAIDHTQLLFAPDDDPEATIQRRCDEAKAFGFASVCIRPPFIPLAKACLAGSPVKVATVINFPADKVDLASELQQPTIGTTNTDVTTSAEVRQAVSAGTDELDVVIPVAPFKADAAALDPHHPQWSATQTYQWLQGIQQNANALPIKLIMETDLLTEGEIRKAVHLCHQLGLFMIKTSTGMVTGGQGATVATVELMAREIEKIGSPLQIKASGGIRDRGAAIAMLTAGASRLGTSAGIAIVTAQPAATTGAY